MQIELAVIGDEVLTGFTINTNATFLGRTLFDAGYVVARETTYPDDPETLKQGLKAALERSDLVITTGGLGPTLDDHTRGVIADLFNSGFTFNTGVADALKVRYGNDFPTIENQATVPENAQHILHNTIGTAPGFIFNENEKTLIVLPGVPSEMKEMFLSQAFPYIKKHFPLSAFSYKKVIHLYDTPEHSVDPLLRELDAQYPDIQFSIYPSLGLLHIHLTTSAKDAAEAEQRLLPPYQEIEMRFAANCFFSDQGTLEGAIHHLFIDNNWTLSSAESCTGGAFASTLTQLPNASNYFLGGIVSYANSVKEQLLNVPSSIIEEKGAVSQEVVEAMARGALKATQSDFSVAISGIAGPSGGSEEKPVGTVWLAVAHKEGLVKSWKIQARGNREMIIQRSVNALLSHLMLFTKEFLL